MILRIFLLVTLPLWIIPFLVVMMLWFSCYLLWHGVCDAAEAIERVGRRWRKVPPPKYWSDPVYDHHATAYYTGSLFPDYTPPLVTVAPKKKAKRRKRK